MNSYDLIIIGGGAAGMMAAIAAKKHHPEKSVAILDRTFELGRKLLTAGAGRGNLTNIHLEKGIGDYYFGDQRFIETVFSQFGYTDIMNFFHDFGVPTYVEIKTGKGKVFPLIDHAKTVRDMLVEYLKDIGIEIVCSSEVTDISKADQWVVNTTNNTYTAKSIILSAGGKTYPALGSDGSGYKLAESIGHTIINPVVSAVPLVSKNPLSHYLQGEKLHAEVRLYIDAKETIRTQGEIMVTQYGFSGPAILDLSRFVSVIKNRGNSGVCELKFCFHEDMDAHDMSWELDKRLKKNSKQKVERMLWGLYTTKSAMGFCAAAKLPKDILASDMTKEQWSNLLETITEYRVVVEGTRGWNEGEFTAGGVVTSEIDPQTMQSKKVSGLFFAGEIVDVDGCVGGFNLSWGWASGWVAGKAALS